MNLNSVGGGGGVTVTLTTTVRLYPQLGRFSQALNLHSFLLYNSGKLLQTESKNPPPSFLLIPYYYTPHPPPSPSPSQLLLCQNKQMWK
jgi:hypothetical protein